MAVVEFEGAGTHGVQHVAIVRDHQQSAGEVVAEVAFEPFDAVDVEVIGGLVENREVRSCDQQPRECYAPFLATAQRPDRSVRIADPEVTDYRFGFVQPVPATEPLDFVAGSRLLGDECIGITGAVGNRRRQFVVALAGSVPSVQAFDHDLANALVGWEGRFLVEILDAGTAAPRNLASVRLVQPSQDSPERTLSAAAVADEPHVLAGSDRQRHIGQHGPIGECLAQFASIDDRHV